MFDKPSRRGLRARTREPESGDQRYLDRVLISFALALALLLPPLLELWMAPSAPWYLPYLVWLGLIALTAVAQRRRRPDGL